MNMSDIASVVHTGTLLLVDDEENVINSLRRVLRSQPYRVLSANSGPAALAILEAEEVDVIISDSRMPGMDGPALLAQVQDRWPAVMRILLTGYSDLKATIKAINSGNIYRYISKPWDDVELALAIEQALAYRRLEQERDHLRTITQEQNVALQHANATLETRVAERTLELDHTAQLLQRANEELHRSYVTATEVFSSLLNQRFPPNRQTNQKVMTVVRGFCKSQNLPPALIDDIAIAAALYNIGKLTWDDTLITTPVEKLDKQQRDRYCDYPNVGESVLMALEPAQEAARFIRHHQERWDGAGFPDGLSRHDIPLGSRILKLAVDFVEMQMGMILHRKLTPEEVVQVMPKYAGRLYDPELCARFVELAVVLEGESDYAEGKVLVVNTVGLEPGMVIMRDLHSSRGTLLLKAGTVLTEKLVDKLQVFEHNEGTTLTLHVRRPEESEHEPPRA